MYYTFTNKNELNLVYSIKEYKNIEDGKNRNKYNKINTDLNNLLNNEKNKINNYYDNNCDWDKLKKFSNEYEFIYTTSYNNEYKNISNVNPISRSFFKLWEIMNNFDFIIPNNVNSLKTAHIAEGPGGFIECLYQYLIKKNINYHTEIYGITLLSNARSIPNWKIKKNYVKQFNINLNNNSIDNGDLYNFENIERFIETVKNKSAYTNSCDFITADGGFDFSENYNEQENSFTIFLICEIYIILSLLKTNGNAIIKIYDIYSKDTIKIMYILSIFFDDILIIKPLSSRPANSEKYLLCKSFISNLLALREYKNLFELIIKSKDLNNLNNYKAPFKFLKHITNYNRFYTNRQIEYIKKTIKLINDVNISNNKKNVMLKYYNENKRYALEWCNNYNIDIKN